MTLNERVNAVELLETVSDDFAVSQLVVDRDDGDDQAALAVPVAAEPLLVEGANPVFRTLDLDVERTDVGHGDDVDTLMVLRLRPEGERDQPGRSMLSRFEVVVHDRDEANFLTLAFARLGDEFCRQRADVSDVAALSGRRAAELLSHGHSGPFRSLELETEVGEKAENRSSLPGKSTRFDGSVNHEPDSLC